MALTDKQLLGLNAASTRKAAGTATATDIKNLDYATSKGLYTPKNAGSSGQDAFKNSNNDIASGNISPLEGSVLPKTDKYQVGRDNVAAAAAVGAAGYNPTTQAGSGLTPSPTTSGVNFDTLLGNINNVTADKSITAANENSATLYDAEKTRLQTSKETALASLDASFAENLASLKESGANQTAAIKARLLKLGVSPSDSSFQNTVQGQLDRNKKAEDALRSEYNSNKIKINSDMEDKISAVTFSQIQTDNENAIAAANNLLQKQGLAKDILSIFNNRDQSELDRENQAYSDLLLYNAKMATLEQSDKEALAKNFIDNAKAGMYNITDENTFKMLSSLEQQYPDYLAGITNIAQNGLQDRILTTAQKEADLNKTELDAEKVQADINKVYNSIKESGENKDELKEIEAFRSEASDLIEKIDTKEIEWSTAFDMLKSKFPKASNATINAQLGGGIPYNEKTGEFYTKEAYGRAKK